MSTKTPGVPGIGNSGVTANPVPETSAPSTSPGPAPTTRTPTQNTGTPDLVVQQALAPFDGRGEYLDAIAARSSARGKSPVDVLRAM